jgi:hypothetical protein
MQLFFSIYRTVFDLAKETKGIMMLEQETNALDIVFFMGSNPRVSKEEKQNVIHIHADYKYCWS